MINKVLLLCVFLLGCSAVDSVQGLKSFKSLAADTQFLIAYKDQNLALWVNGDFVSVINPIGEGTDWSDHSEWDGIYGDSYLHIRCSEARGIKIERLCHIKEITQCRWDASRNRCVYPAPFNGTSKAIGSIKVDTPPFVFNRTSSSSLTGFIEGDNVILSFDGRPTASLPIKGIMLMRDSYLRKRIFRGQFGSEEAEVTCRDYQVGYDNYQVPTFICSVFRDVKGKSGIGFDRAKIGEAVIPWNKNDYWAARSESDNFYVLDRWPRLNPQRPQEVPFASQSKSNYANLIDQEWAAWKN